MNHLIYQHIRSENDVLETNILPNVAKKNKLFSHKHYGFWQDMDTLRDRELLENLVSQYKTPWIR